jgi:hypothetical protein
VGAHQKVDLMIETLIIVLDKIIQLLNRKEKAKKDIFNNVVKPLHTQVERIINDYLKLFHKVRYLIEGKNSITLQDIAVAEYIIEVKKRREEFQVVRISTKEMVKIIKEESKNSAIIKYVELINDLFHCTDNIHLSLIDSNSVNNNEKTRHLDPLGLTWGGNNNISPSHKLVNHMEKFVNGKIEIECLLDFIDKSEKAIIDDWKAIIRQYTKIQLANNEY